VGLSQRLHVCVLIRFHFPRITTHLVFQIGRKMKKYREVESELKRVSDNVEMCSFQMSFRRRRLHATLLPAHVALTVKLKNHKSSTVQLSTERIIKSIAAAAAAASSLSSTQHLLPNQTPLSSTLLF
jgi:hypothetical protein